MKTAAGSTGTGRRHRCRHVGRRPVRLAAVFVVLVVIATAAVDDDVSPGHTAVVAPTVAAAADDVQRQWWPQEHYSCPRISRTAACLFGHRRPRPPTGLDERHVHHSPHYCGKV